MTDAQQLAQAWIDRYEVVQARGDHSPEAQATFSGFELFHSAVAHEPEVAWDAILRVLDLTTNEFVLENLAAGPLENMLAQRGDEFIDRIESHAKQNKQFRCLLEGVWSERISPLIWGRIERVLNS